MRHKYKVKQILFVCISDIDECKNYPCDTGKSTCQNLIGSYRCNCKTGYQNLDAKQCISESILIPAVL